MKSVYMTIAMGLCHLPVFAQDEVSQNVPAFAGVFSDHAVLQRDRAVTLWGTAAPGAEIRLNLADKTNIAVADANGRWQVEMPSLTAGGPYELSVTDTKSGAHTVLNDIMLGDVFLCGGQSNMEMKVAYASNAWGELPGGVENTIRYVTIPRAVEASPLSDLKTPTEWKVIGPQTRAEASATCYYMAKAIHTKEKVAIGLIGSYWGGTVAQAWISEEALRALKVYDASLDILNAYGQSEAAGQAKWGEHLAGRWQGEEPDGKARIAWTKPNFNDSAWSKVSVATAWEESGQSDLEAFDGIAWMRTTIMLTKAEAEAAVRVRLAPIDDVDITWVNGIFVGNTSSWDMPRDYALPKGVLRAGKNVIVVRVTDTAGGGGFRGDVKQNFILMNDGSEKPLPVVWSYRISAPMSPAIQPVNPPWSPNTGVETLYNGMIAPIRLYTIRAVAWYQGESNVYDPGEYRSLLPALFSDWRKAFNQPNLPFLVAQLAPYGAVDIEPGPSGWAELREAQRNAVNADRNAALAVTIDLGDRYDIHPTQKNIVGQRLARAARSVVYGDKNLSAGPDAEAIVVDGNDLIVRFKGVVGTLNAYSANSANAFEVCDMKAACRYVAALPEGSTVRLIGANSPDIVRVRYAWSDAPYTNLYDEADVPVAPFACEIGKAC